ncbi:hypothetical protein N656DRAFT_620293 [Canariomyces notabilis]|uniref:Uncharacterized protein n=1 Tax=Canariomyces notabilis TaxID=2074819 RepID=A0AAN6TFF3_9PEZI|nr:hypothetical protein N656DRAFT_620293 [Canariomyces arenarius]
MVTIHTDRYQAPQGSQASIFDSWGCGEPLRASQVDGGAAAHATPQPNRQSSPALLFPASPTSELKTGTGAACIECAQGPVILCCLLTTVRSRGLLMFGRRRNAALKGSKGTECTGETGFPAASRRFRQGPSLPPSGEVGNSRPPRLLVLCQHLRNRLAAFPLLFNLSIYTEVLFIEFHFLSFLSSLFIL